MPTVHGNLTGLKPSEIKSLGNLYRRKLNPDQIVSPDLARGLAEISGRTGRQVGVLVDRRGSVTHVIAGDPRQLVLPDLGRSRAGSRRFRGLRLLHTHVQGEPLSRDDLTDLSLLRLDLVAAIQVGEGGLPGTVEYATLLPPSSVATDTEEAMRPWRREGPLRVHELPEDFVGLIEALEGEFAGGRRTRDAKADERPRAILVGVEEPGDPKGSVERRIQEMERLADTAGLRVIDTIIQRRHKVDPRTLIGKGKLQELLVRSMYLEADLLVFDRDLNPSQGRTISESTELKVIDRTQLILDIFAQHAASSDGRLQVELAQLKYLLPRMRVMQQGLSRLTGGVGGRGPGETKLEIHGRRARDRITMLGRQLKELARRREVRREQRRRSGIPVAAIVGYTNAGKSTLLNALTRSDVLVQDKLFATLDTTSRLMRFPDQREVVVTDTVGFIEHLPKDLLQAFKATLEELDDADLLLHVVDACDPHSALQRAVVQEVIEDLGLQEMPVLLVLNKVDRMPDEEVQGLVRESGGVPVSALRRTGLDELLERIEQVLWRQGHGDVKPAWMREQERWIEAVPDGTGPGRADPDGDRPPAGPGDDPAPGGPEPAGGPPPDRDDAAPPPADPALYSPR